MHGTVLVVTVAWHTSKKPVSLCSLEFIVPKKVFCRNERFDCLHAVMFGMSCPFAFVASFPILVNQTDHPELWTMVYLTLKHIVIRSASGI